MASATPEGSTTVEGSTTAGPLSLPPVVSTVAINTVDDSLSLLRFRGVNQVWRDVLADEHLWEGLVKRRFGSDVTALDPLPEGCPWGPWQARFLKLARHTNALSDAECSAVTWSPSAEYWASEPQPGAESKKCMVLRNVCWLDLSSYWSGVTAGSYRVLWRMSVQSHMHGLDNLKMDAYVTAAHDLEGKPLSHLQDVKPGHIEGVDGLYTQSAVCGPSGGGGPARQPTTPLVDATAPGWDGVFFRSKVDHQALQAASSAARDRWAIVEAGQVTVPPGCTFDICARMFNTSGQWKRGIVWDTVSLVPVDAINASGTGAGPSSTTESGLRAEGAGGSGQAPNSTVPTAPPARSAFVNLRNRMGWALKQQQ